MVGEIHPRFLEIMIFLRQKSIDSHPYHGFAQAERHRLFGARENASHHVSGASELAALCHMQAEMGAKHSPRFAEA